MFEKIQAISAFIAPLLSWGGTLIYIFKKNLQINAVPWLIWSSASFCAFLNTYLSDGFSIQAIIFFVGMILCIAVVVRHFKMCKWGSLPKWQIKALPLLILSPFAAFFVDPVYGIILQIMFSWITAAAFIQTAASGQTKEALSGWIAGGTGMLFMLLANPFTSWSWILPLSSLLVYASCILSIIIGMKKTLKPHE